MNWIDVKDKLPEYRIDIEEEIVIVSGLEHGKRYVHYAELYAYGGQGDVFSIPGWSEMNVTHWMPLPEPPKE